MSVRNNEIGGLTTVRTVGGLIPGDLLGRVVAGQDLDGLTADDFHLELGVTPREAANRAWSVLTGAWTAYRDALASRPEGDRATGLTREKWLAVLLRELGFGRVPATPTGGLHADDRAFPVSHHTDTLPIHLLGWGVDLDRKSAGVPGAADRAPHAMVQELLNRSDQYLWAIVANGGTLRLLRDSSNLVGQAYVQFDLEAMFDGEVFSDFVALFLLAHQTRFAPIGPSGGVEDCWLERWRADAVETGARALGQLRDGVKRAIESLGTGFLQHPANVELRSRLEPGGGLDLADYHRALLRLVYRLLFCFVAEDRGLLLDPDASDTARARYAEWFSTARLRLIATRRRGTRHADLWQALSLVIEGLGSDDGRPELAIPGVGGLFEDGPADVVAGLALGNDALLSAIRHLCVIRPHGGGPRRNVDYRNLGAEELGGIYESLLELVPRHDSSDKTFTLETLAGNERKSTGAYYTPSSLIECLLDSALDPLLNDAESADDPEAAFLELTVCDPACGSGHFLVAAAKRISYRLARVRADGVEPTVTQAQDAMHDVVAHCIYGVDVNPMAAELAKVSLWLESLSAGRPLTFLDTHIKVGNALLGTTPSLLASGIPDGAFVALEGDDKKTVAALKKRNKTERGGQGDLFVTAGIPVDNRAIADAAREIDALVGLSLADIHLAQQRQRTLESSSQLREARFLADAWCAAFVAPKGPDRPPITQGLLDGWASGSIPIDGHPVRHLVERLAAEYRFFHWHLEFPQVLQADPETAGPGWRGGFACVIGNPPWERTKLQDKEFFAAVGRVDIAEAPNAARRLEYIEQLQEDDPVIYEKYTAARREAGASSHFFRSSGRYPLCGRGDVNTYPLFAEHGTQIIGHDGRFGIITPTGLATDSNTQEFFRTVVEEGRLRVFYDFLNNDRLFYGVGNRTFKFCIFVASGAGDTSAPALFGSFLAGPATLSEPGRQFTMTSAEIARINPNTKTCPLFRTRADAQVLLAIHDRLPILRSDTGGTSSGWGIKYQPLFHMSADSGLFATTNELLELGATRIGPGEFQCPDGGRYLPLIEGKMFNHFDSRWGDYSLRAEGVGDSELPRAPLSMLDDPNYYNQPRYWVPRDEVEARLRDRWSQDWLIAFRDVARAYNERTVISCLLPRYGVGHTAPSLQFENPTINAGLFLVGMLSSFITDWCLRLRQGGTHLTYSYVNQIPVISRDQLTLACPWDSHRTIEEWFGDRVWELLYTSDQLNGAAAERSELAQPFRWEAGRREILRAEIDAGFFRLYGVSRSELAHVLDNFHVVRRKDTELYGTFRTLERIEAAYDRMHQGDSFVSELNPLPGNGPRHDAQAAGTRRG